MNRRECWAVVATFCMGVLAGMYLYLVGFAPTFTIDTTPTQAELESFALEGEQYGGCERAGRCAAFLLRADGSYRYVPPTGVGEGSTVLEGELSSARMRTLRAAVADAPLREHAALVTPTTCPSFADGIDYLYRLTLEGEVYELDSCGTRFGPGDPLYAAFLDVWRSLQ